MKVAVGNFAGPSGSVGVSARLRSWRLAAALLAAMFLPALPPVRAQEPTALDAAQALEKTLTEAIARAEKSVVAIARYRKGRPPLPPPDGQPAPFAPGEPGGVDETAPNEYATGVVIDPQGYILTNYHVLGDPAENEYRIWVNRRPFNAVGVQKVERVTAGDPWTDLAVLKIEAADLEPIAFGDTKDLRKGQIVIALGNPYGMAKDGQVSASWGIISNLGRPLPTAGASSDPAKDSLYQYGGLIQTDARLNLGTSGGALVNLKGEMIGLTTALAASEGYERSLGFAIPVNDVFLRTIETLKTGHKAEFGFLGVSPENLSDAMRRAGQHGAVLVHVVSGTPAFAAGLKEGDIVTHVNGEAVYDRGQLMHELGKQPVAVELRLTAQRGAEAGRPGRVVQATARLSKRHVTGARPPYSHIPDPRWRGMQIDYATALPQTLLRQVWPQLVTGNSLAVIEVERDSACWKAGLRPGTVFSQVDGQAVTTPDEFFAAVAEKAGPVRIQRVSDTPGEVTVAP
ncbi:MAG: trypsin-like peptidase domain-containing protein [Pirellulaceae bacterium]|jgi:serine protease Do|nr:trypsin-like peptidase domain-containing protein [Pirellulaceae bacterium]